MSLIHISHRTFDLCSEMIPIVIVLIFFQYFVILNVKINPDFKLEKQVSLMDEREVQIFIRSTWYASDIWWIVVAKSNMI